MPFLSDFYCLLPELPYTNFQIDKDGWPSVISSIPYWNDFTVKFIDDNGDLHILNANDPYMNESEFENLKQTLSMKTGIITTSFEWLGKIKFNIGSHCQQENIFLWHLLFLILNTLVRAYKQQHDIGFI